MRRIAYCSPVNPQPSGISDYSEELLPYLGRYAAITLFVQRGVKPSNSHLQRSLDLQPLQRLPELHHAQPYDAILYHIGNSPVHAEIYELAQRIPGVVVLHDYVLHHFKLWYAATRQGDVQLYLREMAERYGPRGAAVAARMARGQLLDAAFTMPLVEDVVERAEGIIGHSQYLVDRVHTLRPELPAVSVPMGVPLPPALALPGARRRLALPSDAVLWASFGHINPYKRMEPALRAFRRFRHLVPEAHYLLVGSVSPSYDLDALIRRLGLAAAVTVTGYVSPDQFRDYVAASDVCLNLRCPTAGETSASLLRLLGAGRPTLVSAVDALAELPDGTCAKVDPGRAEGDQILAYGRLLWQAPPVAAALGANARAFIARHHTLQGAAEGYLQFLARLYSWETLVPQRPPLWNVEAQDSASRDQMPPTAPAVVEHQVDLLLQSSGMLDPVRSLARDTGTALAELGVEVGDEAILRDAASVVGSLL